MWVWVWVYISERQRSHVIDFNFTYTSSISSNSPVEVIILKCSWGETSSYESSGAGCTSGFTAASTRSSCRIIIAKEDRCWKTSISGCMVAVEKEKNKAGNPYFALAQTVASARQKVECTQQV